MKQYLKFCVLFISSLALLSASCSSSFLQPPTATPTATLTPTPTFTSTPTNTPTSTPTPTATPDPIDEADAVYSELLKQAMEIDPDFDFTQLRMAYAETSLYDPYDFGSDLLETSMIEAFNSADYDLSLELANQILNENYLQLEPHFVAFRSYEESGDEDKSIYHLYFVSGLVNSILSSGDGITPETAMVVIDIDEEYFILSVLGIDIIEQGANEIDGVMYDIFEGIDSETGNQITVYFDITIPYNWLGNSLGL